MRRYQSGSNCRVWPAGASKRHSMSDVQTHPGHPQSTSLLKWQKDRSNQNINTGKEAKLKANQLRCHSNRGKCLKP